MYIEKINSPQDVKALNTEEMKQLAQEMRTVLIKKLSIHGGHFGPNLGMAEAIIALHYVFNSPVDKFVFDVSHQSYCHKILTGRKDAFIFEDKYDDVSGYANPDESEHDFFNIGHTSTSVSLASGLAKARDLNGGKENVIAVIGDGSMTGGMAFEALNNAGVYDSNLLVILNDNNMAIDPNVGGLNEYLLDISTSKTYNKIKGDVWNVLGKLNRISPGMRNFIQNIDNSIKSMLLKKSNLFEAMGLRYFGPVDGHDIHHLIKILRDLKNIPGPKVLHCITVKGKGFKEAEINQTIWHAPGKFNKVTGERIKENNPNIPAKFQDVFGNTVTELAKINSKIIGITPAMPTGCSLNIMMHEMPDRSYDGGIAEQHAVTFSAGLAAKRIVPFCNIYSSFMQRAYDQVIHDVALQNLNVVFCLDRAGFVGADGATHHGAFDLAYFRCIPNMIIAAPLDEAELRNMMYTAQLPDQGPFSIRYPRGNGFLADWHTPFQELEIGKGRCLIEGEKIAILSIGSIGNVAKKAVSHFEESLVALYDMRFLKPIDEELLHTVFQKFSKIITLEDGTIQGGLGSAVAEFMADHQYHATIKRLGIPDKFIEHGTQQQLYEECGFDEKSITRCIQEMLIEKDTRE